MTNEQKQQACKKHYEDVREYMHTHNSMNEGADGELELLLNMMMYLNKPQLDTPQYRFTMNKLTKNWERTLLPDSGKKPSFSTSPDILWFNNIPSFCESGEDIFIYEIMLQKKTEECNDKTK